MVSLIFKLMSYSQLLILNTRSLRMIAIFIGITSRSSSIVSRSLSLQIKKGIVFKLLKCHKQKF